jgi:hypothetical protein
MTRLDALSTRLAAALRQASEERLRSACLEACEFAVQRTGVESSLVDDALRSLRASKPLPLDYREALEALAGRLDDEYFGLQEAADEGRATVDDYMKPFGQARAVTALSFATDRDALKAANEAIYEAATAVADKEELVVAVLKVLE